MQLVRMPIRSNVARIFAVILMICICSPLFHAILDYIIIASWVARRKFFIGWTFIGWLFELFEELFVISIDRVLISWYIEFINLGIVLFRTEF